MKKKVPPGRKREPRQPVLHRQTSFRGPGGRFVSKAHAKEIKAASEAYEFRRTKSGKYAEAIRLETSKTVIKTTERGMLERPGRHQGQLDWALGTTNITREKHVKTIDVTIRAKTGRDKSRRFQSTMVVTERFDSRMLTAFILDMLRRRGYRTTYSLQQVDWSKVKPSRIACPTCGGRPPKVLTCPTCRKRGSVTDPRRTKTAVSKRKQLKDIQITLRIRK